MHDAVVLKKTNEFECPGSLKNLRQLKESTSRASYEMDAIQSHTSIYQNKNNNTSRTLHVGQQASGWQQRLL